MQIHRGVSHGAGATTQVFAVQPLTQPMPGVVIHHPIRSADRAKAKIVAPAAQGPIEFFHYRIQAPVKDLYLYPLRRDFREALRA